MPTPTDAACVIVTTTTGDRAVAERIATELVDRGLAACVQVSGPIESTYRWEGKVERSQEWVVASKTTEPCWPTIQQLVEELHPYDVPELILTPIVGGSPAYLDWVRNAVATGGDG